MRATGMLAAFFTISALAACSSIGSHHTPSKCCHSHHAHYRCGCGSEQKHAHHKDAHHRHGSISGAEQSGDTEADFAHHLFRHNEGEIAMAKRYLERGTTPELQRLARQSVDFSERQNRELDQLSKNKGR